MSKMKQKILYERKIGKNCKDIYLISMTSYTSLQAVVDCRLAGNFSGINYTQQSIWYRRDGIII